MNESFDFKSNIGLLALIVMWDCLFLGEFKISGSEINKVIFSNSKISDGSIYGRKTNVSPPQLTPESCSLIKQIDLQGVLSDSYLRFMDMTLHELAFNNFLNDGNVILKNISFLSGEKSRFVCKNSDLGKMKLINVDFYSANKVVIDESNVTEITTNAVTWKYDIDQQVDSGLTKGNNHLRDVYRQIKVALERQGDRVEALNFHAREIKCHSKSINFLNNPNDWITLKFGFVNDFGNSWIRPFFIYFVSSFLFFELLVLLTGMDRETMLNMQSYYPNWFRFINPTKFIPYDFKSGLSNFSIISSVVLIVIWKALSVSLVYSIVVSFRKYSRKS